MGKNRFYMCLIIVPVILFAGITSFSQEDITSVNDFAFKVKIRPPVPFAHDDHNEKAEIDECNVCHHVYKDGEKIEDDSSEGMQCSECHLSEDENITMELAGIYHHQCKGCHTKKKAGPVLCSECHRK